MISKLKNISIIILSKIGTFLDDKTYIKILYFITSFKILNLKNPKTFTEKIQWLKLYNRNSEATKMVDKAEVKKLVSDKIGSEYIIPTIGIFNNFSEIDFNKLPDEFVIKCTHDSGGVIICRNKSIENLKKIKKKISRRLKTNYYKIGREFPYKNVEPKILIEELIKDDKSSDLIDYKWYCFNGEPLYCQVIMNRRTKETIDFYNTKWERQKFTGLNKKANNSLEILPKPKNIEDQIKIAKILSQNQKFVRVDLYDVKDKIYFGEITFYPGSGIGEFRPKEWNYILGNKINIEN